MLHKERLLILAKTYPTPSSRYIETSCIAALNSNGEMRRIYPVPFRYVSDQQQFNKWQWITAGIEKSRDDHRPESYRIDVSSIEKGERVDTSNGRWSSRYNLLDKLPHFNSVREINELPDDQRCTLALIKPRGVMELEIVKGEAEWTQEELDKLRQGYIQGSLFDNVGDANKEIAELKKIPFRFYYHYEIDEPGPTQVERLMITDWEAGALYLNCVASHGEQWEKPFRAQYEAFIDSKDLHFLVGTVHRFPNQWLLISVIYPPRRTPGSMIQSDLLF